MVAVTLEADGQVIDDPNEVVYTLQVNGNIGMTAPEAFGNDGVYYTYGIYTKYKNGDYTAADAGIRNITKTIIVPGKGRVDLKFVLHAEEYKAE